MLYRVTVINNENQLSFDFRSNNEAKEFFETVMESLVGLYEGTARIILHRVEENE